MTSSSFWFEDTGLEHRPPIKTDAQCDLIVVGSGIAGMSVAYEAARFGSKVMVIDRAETIGGVMTPRTTAHLATELDDYYHILIGAVGEENARLYYESQVAAVNRIGSICRDEGIDATFAASTGCSFRPTSATSRTSKRNMRRAGRSALTSNGRNRCQSRSPTEGGRCAFPSRAASTR